MEKLINFLKLLIPNKYINLWEDPKQNVLTKTWQTILGLIPLAILIWIILLFKDCSDYTEEYREKEKAEQLAQEAKDLAEVELNSKVVKTLVQKQKEFVALIDSMRTLYMQEENELKLTNIRKDRKSELQKLFKNRNVSNWVGKLTYLSTGSDQKAYVKIKLSGSNYITIENNILLGEGISGSTKMYNNLSEMKEGDFVTFSGKFMYDSMENKDYLDEWSSTEYGSMEAPEFRFIFSSIEKFILED